MSDTQPHNLNDAVIAQLGLRPSSKSINAQIAPNARTFEHPAIPGVYIMESDLYGNEMPAGSVFLAFNSHSGMAGKHIRIETLLKSSVDDIRKMVADNSLG